MSNTDSEQASDGKKPWCWVVDLDELLNHDKPLGKVAIVVNKKFHDWDSQLQAHAHFARMMSEYSGGQDTLKDDLPLLDDVKDAFGVFHALRKSDNLAATWQDTPQWLVENLDNEELGTLCRLANQARSSKNGTPWEFDAEFMRNIRDAVVSHKRDSNLEGEWPFAKMSRAYVDFFLVESMCLWHDENQRLVQQVERLQAQLAELRHEDSQHAEERSADESEPGA